jgi:transcriptional regulator with XRE-family HTH domain
MTNLHVLKFPMLLRRIRAQHGFAQKAVALTLGIDQAQFCAIEKGRRPPFGDIALNQVSEAMKLSEQELKELQWAAKHDRLIRLTFDAALPMEDSCLVSSLLSASRLLDTTQRHGLRDYLGALEAGAVRLKALEPSVMLSHLVKGGAMS